MVITNHFLHPLQGETISTIKDPGTYILSYYTSASQNNGHLLEESNVTVLSKKTSDYDFFRGWRYVEYKIRLDSRTSVKINITYLDTWLDELRLYPVDALMTTFNYEKDSRLLIGIMDENSLTTRFDYDKLLRLTGIRNFEKDYLSLTEYLYKNQTNANNSIRSWTVLKEGQTDATTAKNLGSGDVVKVYSYFDGLGRDLMSASVGTSAAGNDQISFFRYDKFGRRVKQFLPYTLAGNNGAYRSGAEMEQKTFLQMQTDFGANDSNFGFVETELESSPLNRVLKQRAPGSQFNSPPHRNKV